MKHLVTAIGGVGGLAFLVFAWGCGSSSDASGPMADAGVAKDAGRAVDSGNPATPDGGLQPDAATFETFPWETVADDLHAPFSLAVADGRIYYDDAVKGGLVSCDEKACTDTKAFVTTPGGVHRNCLKTYGKDLVFATGEGVYLVATANAQVTPLVQRKMRPTALFVFGTSVYYADTSTPAGTLERVTPGSAPETIASGIHDIRGIYADATDVFFTIYGTDDLQRGSLVFRASAASPASGTSAKISGTDKLLGAHDVRVFGSNVYWTGAGGVFRCPKSGCTGPNEHVLVEKTLTYEGLGGSIEDTALIAPTSVLRDVSLSTPTAGLRDTALGSIAQTTTTTADYIYVVSSSTEGDGLIARRKYRP